jgi:nucleoside 2-deoxyribosyltransferase
MKIFFSAPYTSQIDNDTRLIKADFKAWLEELIFFIKSQGVKVISSHIRENWGENIFSPPDAITADFSGIERSDLLVAYVGEPASAGVLMELGFAAAIKKKVVIIKEKGSELPYFANGLNAWTETEFIEYENNGQLKELLKQRLL